MTGTAMTEEAEFGDIYGLSCVEIPTNRPVQRVDEHESSIALKGKIQSDYRRNFGRA